VNPVNEVTDDIHHHVGEFFEESKKGDIAQKILFLSSDTHQFFILNESSNFRYKT
jgi:hypothetical protein